MSLFKSFMDGCQDLFRLAPLGFSPEEDTRSNRKALPGFAQDAANLADDWRRVGDYLRNAMDAAKAEVDPTQTP